MIHKNSFLTKIIFSNKEDWKTKTKGEDVKNINLTIIYRTANERKKMRKL